MFVFHCTYVRMSYVLNSYLLTYLLTYILSFAGKVITWLLSLFYRLIDRGVYTIETLEQMLHEKSWGKDFANFGGIDYLPHSYSI